MTSDRANNGNDCEWVPFDDRVAGTREALAGTMPPNPTIAPEGLGRAQR
jgi:hypothetical protein